MLTGREWRWKRDDFTVESSALGLFGEPGQPVVFFSLIIRTQKPAASPGGFREKRDARKKKEVE